MRVLPFIAMFLGIGAVTFAVVFFGLRSFHIVGPRTIWASSHESGQSPQQQFWIAAYTRQGDGAAALLHWEDWSAENATGRSARSELTLLPPEVGAETGYSLPRESGFRLRRATHGVLENGEHHLSLFLEDDQVVSFIYRVVGGEAEPLRIDTFPHRIRMPRADAAWISVWCALAASLLTGTITVVVRKR